MSFQNFKTRESLLDNRQQNSILLSETSDLMRYDPRYLQFPRRRRGSPFRRDRPCRSEWRRWSWRVRRNREQKLIELMDIDGFTEVKRNQEQHC
jgi:hypothetical protein